MTTTVENRIAALEQQVGQLSSELARLRPPKADPHVASAHFPSVTSPSPTASPSSYPPKPSGSSVYARYPRPALPPESSTPSRGLRTPNLEDLLGGRLLALVGGIAVVVGIAFFCMVAIDNGWLGEVARVLIAAVGSAGLLATGVWLHRRDGHAQAALAMVGAAIAGLWLTLVAASVLYQLVAMPVALALAVGIGVLATTIAVRWDSRTVAALGIGGTLLAPTLAGILTTGGMAFLAVAGAAAGAVLVWRRWTWLAVGASTLLMAQVAAWSIDNFDTRTVVTVVCLFAVLNLAIVLGHELRDVEAALLPATPPLVVGGALVYAGLAYNALAIADQVTAASLAVLAFAVIHAGFAIVAYRSDRASRAIGHTLLGTSIVLGNIAFALLANGWVQGVGWALSALLIACSARVLRGRAELLQLTLSGQLALAIVQVLVFATPTDLVGTGGQATPGAIAAIASIAIAAGLSARLVTGGRPEFRVAADVVAMIALGFLIAVSLHGSAQLVAWGFASVALARAAAARQDQVALYGSFGFLGLVATYTLGIAAPLESLATGLTSPTMAVVGLGVTAGCCVVARLRVEMPGPLRHTCALAAVGTSLYAASVGIVTVVDGQSGQALMSVLWTASGVAALFVGLRRDLEWLRLGGFAMVGMAVVKVFLVDLSTLGSLARVGSFIALGLLLLAAAYGYQRVRQVARTADADNQRPVVEV